LYNPQHLADHNSSFMAARDSKTLATVQGAGVSGFLEDDLDMIFMGQPDDDIPWP